MWVEALFFQLHLGLSDCIRLRLKKAIPPENCKAVEQRTPCLSANRP